MQAAKRQKSWRLEVRASFLSHLMRWGRKLVFVVLGFHRFRLSKRIGGPLAGQAVGVSSATNLSCTVRSP